MLRICTELHFRGWVLFSWNLDLAFDTFCCKIQWIMPLGILLRDPVDPVPGKIILLWDPADIEYLKFVLSRDPGDPGSCGFWIVNFCFIVGSWRSKILIVITAESWRSRIIALSWDSGDLGSWLSDFAVGLCGSWILPFYFVIGSCGSCILIFGCGTCLAGSTAQTHLCIWNLHASCVFWSF